MMEVSVEATGGLQKRVIVRVPQNEVSEAEKTRLVEVAKEARLPGFRPGKIPMSVIKRRFGPAVHSEVLEKVIQDNMMKALEDEDLKPVVPPVIEEIKENLEEHLHVVATLEVFPKIELKDLSELKIEKSVSEVTDKDVDQMIEKMRKTMGEWQDINRPAKEDDRLKVDFFRQVKDGPKGENEKGVHIVLGAKGMLPGLSKALNGKSVGDVVETTLTYPEDWADSKVAGKEVELRVEIHTVSERPTLSLKQVAEKMDIKEDHQDNLKKQVKETLDNELKEALKGELQEEVLSVLQKENPFDIPASLVAEEKKSVIQEMQNQHRQQGRSHEMGFDEKQVDELAEKRVIFGLLVNEVIAAKDLKVDSQKVDEEITQATKHFPNPSQFRDLYYGNKQLMEKIERKVLLEQVMEVILEEAEVTEKSASFKEVMKQEDEE